MFTRHFRMISMAALAVASVSAQAVPVTYQFSVNNIGVTSFNADLTAATVQGVSVENVTSPTLPAALTNYGATVNFDQSQPVGSTITGGTFSQCSADSLNCISGNLSNFAFQPNVGPFTRVTSVSTILNGTGSYAGAVGSWTNDAFSLVAPSGYIVLGLGNGAFTAGGTTYNSKNGVLANGVVVENPAFPFLQGTETGLGARSGPSSGLPITLTNWQSEEVFDGSGIATSASVKSCSADGVHCIFGELLDYALLDSGAVFHSVSTVAATGGTGIYDGATGQWSNDTYGISYFDPQSGLLRSAFLGLSDGEITINVPEPTTLMLFFLGLILLSRLIRQPRPDL